MRAPTILPPAEHAYRAAVLRLLSSASALVMVLLATVSFALATPLFSGPSYVFRTGYGSGPAVVADLNADGNVDVVAMLVGGYGFVELFGMGDGTLGPPRSFWATSDQPPAFSEYPFDVTCGDFDGDSIPDLAVLVYGGLEVWLGGGDGSFSLSAAYPIGVGLLRVLNADLNGDGRADLLLPVSASDSVRVLLGQGDGTFVQGPSSATGSGPADLAVADLDEDGVPDLVSANPSAGTVSIRRGLGNGGFGPGSDVGGLAGPRWLAIADFNGDSHLDVVVAGDDTAFLAGDGHGGLGSRVVIAASLERVGVADFDADGRVDLFGTRNMFNFYVSGSVSRGVLFTLAGRGDGTFEVARVALKSTNEPISAVVHDLDSDGKPDLVVSLSEPWQAGQNCWNCNPMMFPPSVAVLPGRGDGTFGSGNDQIVGNQPAMVAVADLNSDGLPDIVTGSWEYGDDSSPVSTLIGTGGGSFTEGADFNAGSLFAKFALSDLDGNGTTDLVTSRGTVLLGQGNGTFSPPTGLDRPVDANGLAVGDLDSDGHADVVLATGQDGVAILFGDGSGGFTDELDLATGFTTFDVAVGHLDEDGHPDIVLVGGVGPGKVQVLPGTGQRTFGPPTTYSVSTNPRSVAIGDLNRDGVSDVASNGSSGVALLFGDGTGALAGGVPAVGGAPGLVEIRDMDGDGRSDLVLSGPALISVLPGNGDGTFALPKEFGLTNFETYFAFTNLDFAIADLDADRRPDLVAVTPNAQRVSILMNRGGSIAGVTVDPGGRNPPPGLEHVWPNPSTGGTRIAFVLPRAGRARVAVLDSQGRFVAHVLDAWLPAGRHEAGWDGRCNDAPAAPGVYFVQLQWPGGASASRTVRVR